jgi:4-diphosphocytidyl-2-C-methyl-D-erythritol kinase
MAGNIVEAAPAKINLFLHVGPRRTDGFHPLQSLAVFTDAGDRLTLAPAEELTLRVEGPFASQLADEDDNLVLRAAKALGGPGRPAALTLTKNLPVASGIGGGSSDAAAALRGLARLWALPDTDSLHTVAAGLGSDVPACIDCVPCFMEGRGEILTPAARMPRLAMLLVNPGAKVPTRDVFAALTKGRGTAATLPANGFADTADLLRFLEATANDLDEPARRLEPIIGTVLDRLKTLPGALLARMSGSGATCFAIFADDESCARAAATLRAAHPGWWIAPTFVPGRGISPEEPGRDIGPSPEGL